MTSCENAVVAPPLDEAAEGQDIERRYRLAITALLCDGVFCEEDAAVLSSFRGFLGLADEAASEIFRDEARSYIRRRLLAFLEDGRISPDEDAVLDDLVASVGLGPMWGEETAEQLAKARRTWGLAVGALPIVASSLGLLRGEVAHVCAAATAYEERTRSVGVSYGGLTLSLPIVRGVRFRAGQFGVSRQSLRYQHQLGRGDLTITNGRLIFTAPERAVTMKLTSIIDVTAYNDGVAVQRTVGKPITFVLGRPDEDFALILWRAWQDARGQASV